VRAFQKFKIHNGFGPEFQTEALPFTACEFLGRIANINGRERGGPAGPQRFRYPHSWAQARRPRAASTHPARDLPRQNQRRKSRQPHITQDITIWEQDIKM